ncbi:hypothetical protein [Neisseria leonii]|uniref:hypothetical protein n=1 Tax=Neisseria leonii TaxID=2995413 RepID=UPI00238A6B27|nr:hypothetical protein [Neisseria sp. 3986]
MMDFIKKQPIPSLPIGFFLIGMMSAAIPSNGSKPANHSCHFLTRQSIIGYRIQTKTAQA